DVSWQSNGVSTVSTTTKNYSFNQLLSYSYSERGSAAAYRFTEAGSFANGSYNLDSVTYDSQGVGTYALNLQSQETSTGSFIKSESVTGLPASGTLLKNSTTTESGSFAATDSMNECESGLGAFRFSDEGIYSQGNYALS